MKKLIAICIVGIVSLCSIFSQSLTKDQINTDTLSSIISSDYDVYVYDDGDIRVSYDGYKILIDYDAERYLMKFKTFWQASQNINDTRALKLCNYWNTEKVFTKAFLDKDDDENRYFVLEYFLTTYGGINAANLNDSLDWIFSIADGFGEYLYEEDALESSN